MFFNASNVRAIGFALGGYTSWVLADGCIKLLRAGGLPPYEVIGFLGLSGALAIAAKSWRQSGCRSLRPRNWRAQAVRAALALGINFSVIVALKHLPLALFYAAIFTTPPLVALLAALLLGEAMSVAKWAAVLAGLAGVLIAVDPAAAPAGGGPIGLAAALFSVVLSVANTLWLRRVTQTETADSLIFFGNLAAMVFGFGLLPGHGAALDSRSLPVLAVMGLLSVTGDFWNMTALRLAPAALVEQYHYTQIVTGALLGFVVWGEAPGWNTVIGSAVIIASGLVMARQAALAENP